MLSKSIARDIIDQLDECLSYSINIIDLSGTIIASSDNSRIGTFHELAYQMLQTNTELMEIGNDNEYVGVQSGINMALQFRKQTIGIIGITGDIKTIRPLALVVKKSAELILECEFNKVTYSSKKDSRTQFMRFLLHTEIDSQNLQIVRDLGKKLGYLEHIPRIPIVISLQKHLDLSTLKECFQSHSSPHEQDIITSDDYGNLVIFFSYADSLKVFFNTYKFLIEDYLKEFISYCRLRNLGLKVSIGPLQSQWKNYRFGYEKALWIQEAIHPERIGNNYFYEHIDEYFKTKLPFPELYKIFDTFSDLFDEKFMDFFLKHIHVLYDNDYNFQKSSDELFIHKNTLSFRIDKIRTHLGIDPIQNMKDRELTGYLYYYLQNIQRSSTHSPH